jgi:hypothetical protein
MRKSFFLFVLGLSNVFYCYGQDKTNSQIIGEVKFMGMIAMQLLMLPNGDDTSYRLTFRLPDTRDTRTTVVVSFSHDQKTPDELYELMNEVFTDDAYDYKHYETTILLGVSEVTISRKKLMGTPHVHFKTSRGSCNINKKQLAKLFGKDKDE